MYNIIEITKDYFEVTKINGKEKKYNVDIALKTCSCPSFQFKTKEVKKKYKCKHIKILNSLKDFE